MVRRYLFIKLNPEHAVGLKRVQLIKMADTVLRAAYGVQDVRVETAADPATIADWDLCVTLVFVSGIDLEKSLRDPVTKSFVENFLKERAERVWAATFEKEA